MPKRGSAGAAASSSAPVFVDLVDSDDAMPEVSASSRSRKSARIEKNAAMADDATLLTFPPAPSKESITLCFSDLRRLRPVMPHPGTEHLLLNDTLVDFYVKHLSRPAASLPGCSSQLLPGLDEATRSRVHVFNAFFLKRLRTNLLKGKDLTPLLKWTKGVDLFEKAGRPNVALYQDHTYQDPTPTLIRGRSSSSCRSTSPL